jgi:hypothetical protein
MADNVTNEEKKFPATINGILYKTEVEYDDRVKSDALALAELLYDIYQEKKLNEAKKDL